MAVSAISTSYADAGNMPIGTPVRAGTYAEIGASLNALLQSKQAAYTNMTAKPATKTAGEILGVVAHIAQIVLTLIGAFLVYVGMSMQSDIREIRAGLDKTNETLAETRVDLTKSIDQVRDQVVQVGTKLDDLIAETRHTKQ